MEEGQRSLTAIGSAMMRAAHLLLDDDPKILRDELAVGLSGFESEMAFRAALEAYRAEVAQRFTPDFARFELSSLRAIMAVRNRYAEDELKNALQTWHHPVRAVRGGARLVRLPTTRLVR
jgi:O-methyltransferase involved in polyketide biosynthesis